MMSPVFRAILALLIGTCLLVSCGLKGALYLPDDQQQQGHDDKPVEGKPEDSTAPTALPL